MIMIKKTKKRYGILYGVGVGPGNPELITMKGHRILTQSPIIFIPKRSHKDSSFAFSIIKNFINCKRQEIVELIFPMSKDIMKLERSWGTAADSIYNRLSSGNNCAFLTEGDPFFYSTFLHIYKTFQLKYPFIPIEVIPGITSMNASSCKALFPITDRDGKIAILPALYHIEELQNMINNFDTIVLLKINSVIDKILKIIKECGQPVKTIFVQRCGTDDELITADIASMDKIKADYLSLMIIRKML